jgi:hypothetical protein
MGIARRSLEIMSLVMAEVKNLDEILQEKNTKSSRFKC